jgi:hypothetical protein
MDAPLPRERPGSVRTGRPRPVRSIRTLSSQRSTTRHSPTDLVVRRKWCPVSITFE